jgi:Predicted aminoglycoside phosphotransferase
LNKNDELKIVKSLSGADKSRIAVSEDGWTSRVYIAHGGEFVFKFPRSEKHRDECRHEAKMVELISKYKFDVSVPKLYRADEDGAYFGYFGVSGVPLSEVITTLSDSQKEDIGRQLGVFLRQLHGITEVGELELQTPQAQVRECSEIYQKGRDKLCGYFSEAEMGKLDEFFSDEVPRCMNGIGDTVFSHGDLGGNNILIDGGGRVGVIDFGDAGLYDTTQDFRGIEDEVVLSAMTAAYGASCKQAAGEILSRADAAAMSNMIDVLCLIYYIDKRKAEVDGLVSRIKERM